jgi:predicted GNAT family acetyltransferase
MALNNNISAGRYELVTNGHMSVADYQLNEDKLVITHVEVPSVLSGQGIAAKLMQAIVEDADARSLTIFPVCSYAAAYMQRHPQK